MIIFPAIDLKGGQCVRLKQGDFAQVTVYESDPHKMAAHFVEAGATWMHMVDLDGARDGEMAQFELISAIAKNTPLQIQTGGGIRGERAVEELLAAGVKRVVIGSLAVKNRKLVQSWIKKYGAEHIVVAFDIRYKDGEPEILTHGWQTGSEQLLDDTLDSYAGSGLKYVLCTDVDRDGMLGGTNHELYQSLRQKWPEISVLASGGVDGIDDLRKLSQGGASGAVVGKAIYEGKLDLAAAIKELA